MLLATIADIRPSENAPNSPNGMLLQASYASLSKRTAFLVDIEQPAGTGIYELRYGITSEVTNVGGTENFPAPVRANPGEAVALDVYPTYLTRQGYRVNAEKPWIVDGVAYAAGDMISVNRDVVLVTPNWEEYRTINLTLKPGEGTSAEGDIVYNPGENTIYQAITTDKFVKDGYKLIGWNDGTKNYLVDEEIQLGTQDVTLTAVWTKMWNRQEATEAPATTTIDTKTFYQLEDEADFLWYVNALSSDSSLNAILINDI